MDWLEPLRQDTERIRQETIKIREETEKLREENRKLREFSVKVGIYTTLKGTLIFDPRGFPGTPYDGLTLNESKHPDLGHRYDTTNGHL